MIEIIDIYYKQNVLFSKACTPVEMVATAQSGSGTDSIPDEVEHAFSGLPQSTPL